MNKLEFYAKCYFVLSRFPLSGDFYDRADEDKSKTVSQHIDNYCRHLLQSPLTASRIQEDFDKAFSDSSEET